MSSIINKGGPKYTEVSAIITRADGTTEDLGVICQMKKPSMFQRIKQFILKIKGV